MYGAARLLVVLAFAAAAQAAAANDRFIPSNPYFVVANVKQAEPDAALRALITHWRADPANEDASITLAQGFLDRARSLREPMYVGRAESVLAAAATKPGASAAARRLYAQTLQYRHDFPAAESLLSTVLNTSPHDAAARVQRASVRLVRGDFAGARGDCAQLLAGGAGDAMISVACLAEAYAGTGRIEQATAMLESFPARAGEAVAARAYLLALRAELHERANDLVRATTDYTAALSLAPGEDSIRAALADVLAARGQLREAAVLLDIDRPSLALLVRRAQFTRGAERDRLRKQAAAWLALESARGDAPHDREAAILALDCGDLPKALAAARSNFSAQKELADVRVLARTAVAARDVSAQLQLREWLRKTGYHDAVAENALAAAGRG